MPIFRATVKQAYDMTANQLEFISRFYDDIQMHLNCGLKSVNTYEDNGMGH